MPKEQYVTVYNPSDSPVVVDEEGRVIGGQSWGTLDRSDPIAKGLLKDDLVSEVSEREGSNDVVPAAVEAFERTKGVRERRRRASEMDVGDLRAIAEEADLIEPGEQPKPGKKELVEMVAENQNVPLPSDSNNEQGE